MSTPAKAHEPSMEEILASIRRIISDDEPAPAMARKATPPAPEPAPAADDASGLGQDDIDAMFAEMDAVAAPTPKPEAKPELVAPARPEPQASPPVAAQPIEDDLDVLELTDEIAPPEFEPVAPKAEEPLRAPERRPAPEPAAPLSASFPQQPAPPSIDRLLSPSTDESVSNAFGSLAHTILAGNARTLDDIVREMLRPMLRAWLDDNLPPLVERLVRQEIERVARGGR